MTYRLPDAQAHHALDLFERFPGLTGMYVGQPTWNKIDAFLTGYLASWPEGAYDAVHEFAAEHFGLSPVVWSIRTQQRFHPEVDRDRDLGREGGEEAAALLCTVLRDFVRDQLTHA